MLGQFAKKQRKILRLVYQFFKSTPREVKRNENTFRFEAKRSKETFISIRFEAKRKNQKRNEKFLEAKQSEKYALIILLWSEAKKSKQKEAKCMQNGSGFTSFRF